MKNDNPFYSLRDSKTYMVHKLFKLKGLDPKETMQDILVSATISGGYTPRLRFPTPEKKAELAKKFRTQNSTAKHDPEKAYLAGANAIIRHLEGLNTKGEYLKEETEHKLFRPIDLSLRQLAFVAKVTKTPYRALLSAIAKGVAPSGIDMLHTKDWKREYELEKLKHEETKNRLGQIWDEKEAARRIIAELRRELHKEGLQDPTLQIREEGGSYPVDATHEDDAPNENP